LVFEGDGKRILNDLIHLNNRRLPFLKRLAVRNRIIVIEMKVVPETILKVEILLIFSIEIAALEGFDVTDVVAEINGTRRSPATKIRSNLGAPHDGGPESQRGQAQRQDTPAHHMVIQEER
jgi:hypothetical protein